MSDASAPVVAGPLARLSEAVAVLATVTAVDAVKEIRDQAEALRLYTRERDMGLEAQNYCAEIKLRAERRLGEILARTVRPGNPQLSNDSTIETRLPEGISRDQSSAWQRIASVPEAAFEEHIERTKALREELTTTGMLQVARKLQNTAALFSSESFDWYTPSLYLEAAREVLGEIDLDPASSEAANRTVRARRYFSLADDGLAQSWTGRVWLNPPYGGQGPHFVGKLIDEHTCGHVTAAVLLLAATATSNQWFRPLWAHVLCFTDHRISFVRADGFQGGTPHGSIFVYLGPHPRDFARVFAQFGAIVRQWPAPGGGDGSWR